MKKTLFLTMVLLGTSVLGKSPDESGNFGKVDNFDSVERVGLNKSHLMLEGFESPAPKLKNAAKSIKKLSVKLDGPITSFSVLDQQELKIRNLCLALNEDSPREKLKLVLDNLTSLVNQNGLSEEFSEDLSLEYLDYNSLREVADEILAELRLKVEESAEYKN